MQNCVTHHFVCFQRTINSKFNPETCFGNFKSNWSMSQAPEILGSTLLIQLGNWLLINLSSSHVVTSVLFQIWDTTNTLYIAGKMFAIKRKIHTDILYIVCCLVHNLNDCPFEFIWFGLSYIVSLIIWYQN